MRENYVDTLGNLYEYSTTVYRDNKLSQVIDGDLFYTYGSFKKKSAIQFQKNSVSTVSELATRWQSLPTTHPTGR